MNISFTTDNLIIDIKNSIAKAKEATHIAAQGKSWDDVFTPIDRALSALHAKSSKYSHLVAVNYSDELNTAYEKTLPLLSRFYSELGTNIKLYQAYKQLNNHHLSDEQQHILSNRLLEFELAGIHLASEQQKQITLLKEELSVLSNTFAKNSLQATTNYKYQIAPSRLTGVPKNEMNTLQHKDGKYYLSLNYPSYIAVMTFCEVESTRERLYRAYMSRASTIDGYDNMPIVRTILKKRKELAQLLGYNNYAEYSLATKMVQNPADVEAFILELISKSHNKAKYELAVLTKFAGKPLQAWDYLFYSEKLKQHNFGIDAEVLKQYFPFEHVLKELLTIIAQLYALEYSITEVRYYNQTLKLVTLVNNDKVIGELLIDPFAREYKRSGAWMSDYKELDTARGQTPIAFVVCNGSKPTKDVPSLLTFDDIVTLFHEFGHALHHVLTTTIHPSVAGISGVPWDGVELPSQYMEFFAYEPENIKRLSAHYMSGETLTDEMIQNIIDAKNFHTALLTLRQCEFALWDIRTHTLEQDTYEILSEVRELTALLPHIKHNYFLNSFGHIFAGGYAAGYYSYKWAEVMAADAYKRVMENIDKAQDFRTHILEIGGSKDFLTSYLTFSEGEQPQMDALLTMSGIT